MTDKPMTDSEATTAGAIRQSVGDHYKCNACRDTGCVCGGIGITCRGCCECRQSVEAGERCPKCGADRIPYQPCPELQVHHECGTVTAARDGRLLWHSAKCLEAQLAAAKERAAKAIDERVLALNERVKQARAMIAEERQRAELAEAHNAQLRAALEDLAERAERARRVLQESGRREGLRPDQCGWGVLDTTAARAALADAPANPYAAVIEAARALAVTLYQHNEAAIKRFHIEVLGRGGEIDDDEGYCCETCCEVSDLLYDLGQKLGEIGIDDLSKIPDIRDLAKLDEEADTCDS